MASEYYKPCKELDICNELIDKFFHTQQYERCFEGHLSLAEQGYPLAECQIGYFYYEGLGVEKNLEKAVYWTRRAADHGDRDGQYNLAWFYEDAIGVERDIEQSMFWYRKAALQGHDLAIEKCKELAIDLDAPAIDRETIRKNLQCRIYPLGYLERYKYTVICTSYQGKWVLSRHKKRDTWETQGGHIEAGETPLQCARRELFEESGIQDADIYPVCDYWGFNSQACSNGMVFLAVVHSLGELPESEMKEIKVFDSLPDELTYPQTSPKLYGEAEKLLLQLNNFLIDCPATDSFSYVKKLQAEFDLSQIPYTEDYYDPEMNAAAPEVPTEWAVYYEHGFWNKNAIGKPGEEIILNKSFAWGDEIWHIPAVYSCTEGLVVDFCVEIQPEKEKAFIDKWYPILSKDRNISRELREQMEQENPMDIKFRIHLQVNEKMLIAKHGNSLCWIPQSCLPDGERCVSEAKELIKHYGLDETKAWSFHRWSFPWTTKRKTEIKSIRVKLERNPVAIPGIQFENPSVGDVITFVHPIHNTEHKLTVLGYERQEFSGKGFQQEEYEFPTLHTAMTYTLEPELPVRNFQIRDCLDNEQPKRKPKNQFEPQASYDACSIAIIGGADGPTAIFTSAGHKVEQHCALSALRFEHANDIVWKIVFHEKLMEDVEAELLYRI